MSLFFGAVHRTSEKKKRKSETKINVSAPSKAPRARRLFERLTPRAPR